ncbi:T9SS type A sorting domain-containing protein [Neolewinella persica]|uniref:T9SS type A sorting domain-containing protein n=1 Tax=Neolewinella persica TaxID=70998 RepID=UPI00039FFB03|nr:T9SS type A sorting domain-containing protein [Neolewinella persica]
MLLRYRLLFLLLAFGLPVLTAQTCDYQLVLEDRGGNGWNGGILTLRINGIAASPYTLTPDNSNGSRRSYYFSVNDEDNIQIGFAQGAFPEESVFSLLNNADSLLYTNAAAPVAGNNVFAITANCIACAPPAANSIEFFRVRATTADLKFRGLPAAENPLYRIQYRGGNYDPSIDDDGTTITGTNTQYRIENLESDSLYTFWIDAVCRALDDTSKVRGPYVIKTQKRVDVGITQLMAPATGCDLTNENVTIGITNFGGEPQAFFNVDFAIDGFPAGVERPQDGIFTGVVGVDSTEFFTFDIQAFLDIPGTYEFTIWTELEGDEDNSNDTLTISVTNIPQITDFPYTEGFEADNGFWYVDRQGRGVSSWAWGKPNNELINRAPQGRNAWVTNLTGDYNNLEESYLVSPCFDLSDMENDPLFTCQLFVDTEAGFDGVSLEITSDGGETWRTVETSPAGINWYNDLMDQRWTRNDTQVATVAQFLEGVAGDTIQLRFAFRSNAFETAEGILVDAVSLTERADRNLAAAQAFTINPSVCSSPTDSVRVRFSNLGLTFAEDFDLNYRVNGGTVITEAFPGSVRPGQSTTFIFATPFDGTLAAESRIEVWTSLTDDVDNSNDTTVFFLRTREDIPFFEGFARPLVPAGWVLDEDLMLTDLSGMGNFSIYDNLNSTDTTLLFRTTNYGNVASGDSLRFSVVFREFDTDTPYTDSTRMTVRAYIDCAETSETIAELTLAGDSIVAIDLESYAGSSLQFEVFMQRDSGDFDVTFDDFNIKRCADNLGLMVDVIDVTSGNVNDGAATVIPGGGVAPFNYSWPGGQTANAVDNLVAGTYTVMVTDAVGCTDEVTFRVSFPVATTDPANLLTDLQVFPNPTSGLLEVKLELPEASTLRAAVYDLTGRQLQAYDFGRQLRLNEQLDFSAYPAGIYLLRLRTADAARTIRVVLR